MTISIKMMMMVIKREYKSGVEAAGGERRWRGGESNWIFKKCSLSATTRWPAWWALRSAGQKNRKQIQQIQTHKYRNTEIHELQFVRYHELARPIEQELAETTHHEAGQSAEIPKILNCTIIEIQKYAKCNLLNSAGQARPWGWVAGWQAPPQGTFHHRSHHTHLVFVLNVFFLYFL